MNGFNYIFAFLLCVALSVMALLTKHDDAYWLLVSDANVAIWLFVAWMLDPWRPR